MRKTKTGRVAAAKARLERATRLAEIVMDALDQFPPAQRAAKLREYKLFLAKGLKSFPSQKKGGQIARLCVRSYSDKMSLKAMDILEKAGFLISASPVAGLGLPELTVGPYVYYGVQEIQTYVDSLNPQNKVLAKRTKR